MTTRPDWFALGGVVVSIGLHIVLDAEKPFLPFIVGCCLFWLGFVVWRVRQNPDILHDWGFRCDNLRRAIIGAIVFAERVLARVFVTGSPDCEACVPFTDSCQTLLPA